MRDAAPSIDALTELREYAYAWLSRFETALRNRNVDDFEDLFVTGAFWRDVVAFTWDIRWAEGRDRIRDAMLTTAPDLRPRNFRLAQEFTPPARVTRVGRDVIEFFFHFDTRVGQGSGLVRLVEDVGHASRQRAWTILTTLQAPHEFAGASEGTRHPGVGYDRHDTTRNWLDHRRERRDYSHKDPEVLIVGGGHAGLTVAARLGAVGVDALVIDRHPRIGDNWRRRYKSLALHSKADVVQFPYLSFPTTFPTYIPKDQFANWHETYVESLDLSYQVSTELVSARYDAMAGAWTARIRGADGKLTARHPRHIVLATGMEGGQPRVPHLPGMKTFRGEVLHTSAYQGGAPYAAKRVLVVGTASSGHDVAYDLHHHGADVTMLQRSPTTVISLENSHLFFAAYTSGISLAEADLQNAAFFIYPLMQQTLREVTRRTNESDRELHEGLERAGFSVDDGEDHTGYIMKLFRYGGRYYINVGCSDLIISGDIAMLQTADLRGFVDVGVQLTDGTVKPFDAVIMATGYSNMKDQVAQLFGSSVAERVGNIGGLDEGGEYRNLYKPTAQRGLWFAGGGIPTGRIYSVSLALLIKAELEGWREATACASGLATPALTAHHQEVLR